MSRIYDYTAFSSKAKKGSSQGDYSFGVELKYIDIDIFDRPEEYADLDDAKVFLEYSIDVIVKKAGIDSFVFTVNSIELEFSVDDYPNDTREFDMDLIPGKTISYDQIKIEELDSVIPSYPSKLEINMNKSTDPKKYEITVYFGNDIR